MQAGRSAGVVPWVPPNGTWIRWEPGVTQADGIPIDWLTVGCAPWNFTHPNVQSGHRKPSSCPLGEVGARAVLLWESNSEKEGLQLELTIPGKCLLEP